MDDDVTSNSWSLPPLQHAQAGPLPRAQLCRACSSIFVQPVHIVETNLENLDVKYRAVPTTLSHIRRNAAEGTCGLCFLFMQSARSTLPASLTDASVEYRFGARKGDAQPNQLLFEVKGSFAGSPQSNNINMLAVKDLDNLSFELSDSTNSRPTVVLIKKWLKKCTEDHTRCRSVDRQSPTRLVYLGEQAGVVQPRLVLSRHMNTQYCTLSHCWGPNPSQMLQLTKKTLSAMQTAIPVERLSRTFREAMEVAKRLGIDYIWIDSLCIVQDDTMDWRAEATRMGEVYTHSVLNIAATRSTAGEGCWTTRRVPDVMPCRIDLEQPYVFHNPNLWNQAIVRSPLSSRGWVVQEFVLSQRMVHFAEDQVFWECEELQANETFPGGIAQEYDKLSVGDYLAWDKIVGKFTAARLTSPRKDKLLAISSVATLKDRLLAGLWEERLPWQLLWSCHGPYVDNEYQAPSWSWASQNRAVSSQVSENGWQSMLRKIEAKQGHIAVDELYVSIREVQLSHEEEDDRGPLIGGHMFIIGPMRKVDAFEIVKMPKRVRISFGGVHADLLFDRKAQSVGLHLLWALGQGDLDNYRSYGLMVAPRDGQWVRLGMWETAEAMHTGNTKAGIVSLFSQEDDIQFSESSVVEGIPRYKIKMV